MLDGVYCVEVNNSPLDVPLEVDVVFVHGLSATPEKLWRNMDNDLWPLWLRQVHLNCRVLLLHYPSTRFFGSRSSGISIKERARNIADLMPVIGIGLRPTVFVCHSLGGILIKEVIRCCVETGCALSVASNTIGVIFLATPHLGADIAKKFRFAGSSITKDLMRNSRYLIDLKSWFSAFVSSRSIYISSYYECYAYRGVIIVDEESADPACKGCVSVGVDYDHFNIVEPKSPNNDIFLRISRDIKNSINKLNNMSECLASIEEIIALPEITNHMYFKIVDFLNRLFYADGCGQKAFVISNPCGNSRPSCVIISKDLTLLLLRPLKVSILSVANIGVIKQFFDFSRMFLKVSHMRHRLIVYRCF